MVIVFKSNENLDRNIKNQKSKCDAGDKALLVILILRMLEGKMVDWMVHFLKRAADVLRQAVQGMSENFDEQYKYEELIDTVPLKNKKTTKNWWIPDFIVITCTIRDCNDLFFWRSRNFCK